MIAIFATLFGSATSLGLGALQITGGLDNVLDSGGSRWITLGVIVVLTLCFVASAVTGIEKGVQYLSNANAIAALLLVFFLFVVGPTVFIMGTFTESLGGYLTHLPTMAFRTGAFGGADWINGWTVFYWAWWISWTPFVGMFIARISKGRTIRQFVVYVILVPSLVSFVWFSIMAGSAFDLQFNGVDLGAVVNSEGGTERVLFETLREYPLSSISVVLAVFLIAIFFITGADSASIVMGMLSQHGEEHPMRSLVIFWGVAQGAVAAVLLWSGGLSALQTLVIIVAGPFMLVIVAMAVSLMKSLRAEPYESTLPSRVRRAVLHAQKHDLVEHQTVALAVLGAEPADGSTPSQSDGVLTSADVPPPQERPSSARAELGHAAGRLAHRCLTHAAPPEWRTPGTDQVPGVGVFSGRYASVEIRDDPRHSGCRAVHRIVRRSRGSGCRCWRGSGSRTGSCRGPAGGHPWRKGRVPRRRARGGRLLGREWLGNGRRRLRQ